MNAMTDHCRMTLGQLVILFLRFFFLFMGFLGKKMWVT